jgi:hypothetical protein|tara:strand:+ start:918 stop:1259 length:342 start_codon:yes stop_codon:yes gene_type:complete
MTPLDTQEEAYMLEEDLARLAEFDALEAKKQHWAPYHKLDAKLTQMYRAKETLENAASYADQGEDECRAIGVYPSHHASDELWDCYYEIEKLITKTEEELEELNKKLEKEEEE